jgi:hypothetical protein
LVFKRGEKLKKDEGWAVNDQNTETKAGDNNKMESDLSNHRQMTSKNTRYKDEHFGTYIVYEILSESRKMYDIQM